MGLTPQQIQELLKPKEKAPVGSKYPKTPQVGPLRWYDREMRCAKRGCSSPTYCKVQGVPYCMKHSLEELNLMLVAAGYQGVVSGNSRAA